MQFPMSTDTPQAPPEHHFQHDPEKTELEKVLHTGAKSLEPYFNQILIGVVLVAVVIAGLIYWSRSTGAISPEGWKDFASYQAPSDFKALAEKHPDTAVAHWALLEAGRRYTAEGLQQAMVNRAASDESLGEARTALKKLLDQGNAVPVEIREEALFSLANCLEALAGENIDEAINAYKTLTTEFPESRHRKWAEARMKALEAPGAKDFYVWFREQNPSPQDRKLPSDLLNSLGPALPPVPVPPSETNGPPADSVPATESSPAAEAKPAETTNQPAEEAKPESGADKPAEPATEATPAAESPVQ